MIYGVLLAGCIPPAPSPEECPSEFASATPYDGRAAERLPGLYQVTMVPTSYGTTRRGYLARLLLAPPDTLRRYYPERYRHGDLLLGQQVAGVWTERNDSTTYQDHVSVDGHNFYLGCRVCLDASPVRFAIERVTATGFWGHWENPQTGISRIYDTAGRELPNPAGIYCAVRVSDSFVVPSTDLTPRRGACNQRMQLAVQKDFRGARACMLACHTVGLTPQDLQSTIS